MLDIKILEILNQQYNKERYNSVIYLNLQYYCELNNLINIAQFFKKESNSELDHANQISEFIINKNEKIITSSLQGSNIVFNNIVECFETAYKAEKENLISLNNCLSIIESVNDLDSKELLLKMINDQIKSVQEYKEFLDKLYSIKDEKDYTIKFDNYIKNLNENKNYKNINNIIEKFMKSNLNSKEFIETLLIKK